MSTARNLKLLDFEEQNEQQKDKGLASDKYREMHSIARVEAPNGMSREITNDAAKRIHERIRNEAQAAAEEEGLFMCFVNNQFSQDNTLQQDVTIKLSASHALGFDRFTQDLLEGRGRPFKFKPEYYGKAFIRRGVEYVITGVDVSDPNTPYVLLRSPNGNMLANAVDVHKYLKRNDII